MMMMACASAGPANGSTAGLSVEGSTGGNDGGAGIGGADAAAGSGASIGIGAGHDCSPDGSDREALEMGLAGSRFGALPLDEAFADLAKQGIEPAGELPTTVKLVKALGLVQLGLARAAAQSGSDLASAAAQAIGHDKARDNTGSNYRDYDDSYSYGHDDSYGRDCSYDSDWRPNPAEDWTQDQLPPPQSASHSFPMPFAPNLRLPWRSRSQANGSPAPATASLPGPPLAPDPIPSSGSRFGGDLGNELGHSEYASLMELLASALRDVSGRHKGPAAATSTPAPAPAMGDRAPADPWVCSSPPSPARDMAARPDKGWKGKAKALRRRAGSSRSPPTTHTPLPGPPSPRAASSSSPSPVPPAAMGTVGITAVATAVMDERGAKDEAQLLTLLEENLQLMARLLRSPAGSAYRGVAASGSGVGMSGSDGVGAGDTKPGEGTRVAEADRLSTQGPFSDALGLGLGPKLGPGDSGRSNASVKRANDSEGYLAPSPYDLAERQEDRTTRQGSKYIIRRGSLDIIRWGSVNDRASAEASGSHAAVGAAEAGTAHRPSPLLGLPLELQRNIFKEARLLSEDASAWVVSQPATQLAIHLADGTPRGGRRNRDAPDAPGSSGQPVSPAPAQLSLHGDQMVPIVEVCDIDGFPIVSQRGRGHHPRGGRRKAQEYAHNLALVCRGLGSVARSGAWETLHLRTRRQVVALVKLWKGDFDEYDPVGIGGLGGGPGGERGGFGGLGGDGEGGGGPARDWGNPSGSGREGGATQTAVVVNGSSSSRRRRRTPRVVGAWDDSPVSSVESLDTLLGPDGPDGPDGLAGLARLGRPAKGVYPAGPSRFGGGGMRSGGSSDDREGEGAAEEGLEAMEAKRRALEERKLERRDELKSAGKSVRYLNIEVPAATGDLDKDPNSSRPPRRRIRGRRNLYGLSGLRSAPDLAASLAELHASRRAASEAERGQLPELFALVPNLWELTLCVQPGRGMNGAPFGGGLSGQGYGLDGMEGEILNALCGLKALRSLTLRQSIDFSELEVLMPCVPELRELKLEGGLDNIDGRGDVDPEARHICKLHTFTLQNFDFENGDVSADQLCWILGQSVGTLEHLDLIVYAGGPGHQGNWMNGGGLGGAVSPFACKAFADLLVLLGPTLLHLALRDCSSFGHVHDDLQNAPHNGYLDYALLHCTKLERIALEWFATGSTLLDCLAFNPRLMSRIGTSNASDDADGELASTSGHGDDEGRGGYDDGNGNSGDDDYNGDDGSLDGAADDPATEPRPLKSMTFFGSPERTSAKDLARAVARPGAFTELESITLAAFPSRRTGQLVPWPSRDLRKLKQVCEEKGIWLGFAS